MKRLTILVLLGLLLVTLWLLKDNEVPSLMDTLTGRQSTGISTPSVPSTTQATAPLARMVGAPNELPDPQFQKWLSEAALQVNRPKVDRALIKAEMDRVLKNLTLEHTRQLLFTALNPAAPAGERILAIYLLAEGGTKTMTTLSELASSPPVDFGPRVAHGEAEAKGMQERSLRIMAIDALASQARQHPEARAALAQLVPTIVDASIRAYAQRKLDALSHP